ncbi:ATP-binding cassette domain-containing protein [Streptomyces oryzae]|uniref:ATP-binding cassette domain-containing protein n=1 Tax=Streptomyces oryzae TaxID=1434886 RepID=A0ABS3X7V3_9ACTN|nr:ATP-binding cassette domain-containing protein [Streptomyces oryzae]MBO8191440.1 ATP-binding cassette domain-containing protein [Streptomyces oryzae]
MRLERVGRRYRAGGPWVLRGVDLDVRAGTLVRVEGGNGSGKSTLLRLVAGIDAPSAGRIRGRPRTRGYVPERFPAALPLTALGYLTHLGRVRGLGSRAAAREGACWLERFGAQQYAATSMRELSKGSAQKVAVAQALVGGPELLVLDEAWTGLDQPAREVLDSVVRERVAEGGTVAFVDHDPARLAGAPDVIVRVGTGGRVAVAGAGAAAPEARVAVAGAGDGARGPAMTRIEALGAPGAGVPEGLPASARCTLAPDGELLLTLPAAASDTALRVLLTARPGWHIRSVRPLEPFGERERDRV